MSYQVLARKWRPKVFSDVVGQEHIITILINSLLLKRFHHAYLFSGARGVGKTSIARLLAKGLTCKADVDTAPCGICNDCYEIEKGCFIDLVEIDAASNTKVEDIRDLLDGIQYAPARGQFKIYLIDEVHMLSRYSFNMLLKTLEEPPPHIKFFLATTDPKKLPITILSRCFHFHLKVLDEKQIYCQLKYIMNKEQIVYESCALKLLARAADGSLRDALNLADQAIVSGKGMISEETVRSMLNILDDNQALSLLEAIVVADGTRVMTLINEIASHGIEWESLLTEILVMLHRIAMAQLSSIKKDLENTIAERRIQKLARTVSPTDVQLYYQIFLIGRKELSFAPNQRIGIEITLLRALAFHPKTLFSESEIQERAICSLNSSTMTSKQIDPKQLSIPKSDTKMSSITNQILTAQDRLQCIYKKKKMKDNEQELFARKKKLINNAKLEHLALMTKRVHSRFKSSSVLQQNILMQKEENNCQETSANFRIEKMERSISKMEKKSIKHKNVLELKKKITNEVNKRDAWAAEINKLRLPKLAEQVALNSWKEQDDNRICLHLRSNMYHLNSEDVQNTLIQALSSLQGTSVELTIIKDDNLGIKTPLEWKKDIYTEKFIQAREIIIADNNIQTLRHLFDAELDEESICPI